MPGKEACRATRPVRSGPDARNIADVSPGTAGVRYDGDCRRNRAADRRELDGEAQRHQQRAEEHAQSRVVRRRRGESHPTIRRPRLKGRYTDYASEQLSAEVTLTGALTLFGQRQEVTLGVSRRDHVMAGGLTNYSPFIASSVAAPSPALSRRPRVIATRPPHREHSVRRGPSRRKPRRSTSSPLIRSTHATANRDKPLPTQRFSRQGQGAIAGLRELQVHGHSTGCILRRGCVGAAMSMSTSGTLCTSTTTPAAVRRVARSATFLRPRQQCVVAGRSLPGRLLSRFPTDATNELVAYPGYADIYQDLSSYLTADLERAGSHQGRECRARAQMVRARRPALNAALSVYSIEREGFMQPDTSVPFSRPDPFHMCCYFQRRDQTEVSEGVDAELTGEVLPGLASRGQLHL